MGEAVGRRAGLQRRGAACLTERAPLHRENRRTRGGLAVRYSIRASLCRQRGASADCRGGGRWLRPVCWEQGPADRPRGPGR